MDVIVVFQLTYLSTFSIATIAGKLLESPTTVHWAVGFLCLGFGHRFIGYLFELRWARRRTEIMASLASHAGPRKGTSFNLANKAMVVDTTIPNTVGRSEGGVIPEAFRYR